MAEITLELYGIAHMIFHYARGRRKEVIPVTDIEEYLFSMDIQISESQLHDTFKEMQDAGWITEIDEKNMLVFFNSRHLRKTA